MTSVVESWEGSVGQQSAILRAKRGKENHIKDIEYIAQNAKYRIGQKVKIIGTDIMLPISAIKMDFEDIHAPRILYIVGTVADRKMPACFGYFCCACQIEEAK